MSLLLFPDQKCCCHCQAGGFNLWVEQGSKAGASTAVQLLGSALGWNHALDALWDTLLTAVPKVTLDDWGVGSVHIRIPSNPATRCREGAEGFQRHRAT